MNVFTMEIRRIDFRKYLSVFNAYNTFNLITDLPVTDNKNT